MASLRVSGVILAVGALVAACGGASFNGLQGGGDAGNDGSGGQAEGGADAPAGGDDRGGTNDGTTGTGDATAGDATAGDAASDGVGGGGDSATDGPAPPCPDESGLYTMSAVDAQGCGNLNLLALECIQQSGCDIMFQSRVTAAAGPGIDGDPALQSDGSFSNGALKEGTVSRSGCTGAWDATTSTLTVDCGGTGSSQSCVVALKRTASNARDRRAASPPVGRNRCYSLPMTTGM